VLLFTIAVCVATALLAGLIPAMRSSRTDINEVLKDETRGSSSLRIGRISRLLVVFEVALSCILLAGAGLMIKSFTNMRAMDLGFTTKHVFTARLGFPPSYTDSLAERRFFDQVLERVAAIPGVKAAALSSGLPAAEDGLTGASLAVEGQTYRNDDEHPTAQLASVTPNLFEVVGTPIVAGRAFTEADRLGALPVVIVNRAFVQRYLHGTDPIGRRVRIYGAEGPTPWLTVVGVAGNTFTGNQDDPMEPALYRPLAQAPSTVVSLTARTAGPPLSITQEVRDVVGSLDRDLPLFRVQSFDDAIAPSFTRVRVLGPMFTIFGLVALFLAWVGLYAVMSFSVSHRTREVGIRMALGARGVHVVRMILGQGAVQLAAGLTVGMALAFIVSGVISHILFEVDAHDPLIFGGVAATLALVGLIACLIPAARATLIDPLVAMRAE
jgi:putative ABC transport system permease protein